MNKLLLVFAASALLTSCVTTRVGTAKTMDITGQGVMHKPVVVNLDVKQEKVSKTVILKDVTSIDNAKNEVVRDLLREKNADVLVEPSFDSKTKNSTTELTVFGYAATYKNFRNIEEKDIKFLELKPNAMMKADVYTPVADNGKGKGKGLWILLGSLVLTGIILKAAL
ncbi:MAG: hypothetical protein H7174_03740 [Flavobacterium sp.]|nr:hypothetical protein [Flavobacterium sp.]